MNKTASLTLSYFKTYIENSKQDNRAMGKNSGSTRAGDFESETSSVCPTLRDLLDRSY